MKDALSKFVTSRKFMISVATCIAPIIAIAFSVDEKLVMEMLDKLIPIVMVYVGGESAVDIMSRFKSTSNEATVDSKVKLNG